MALAADFGIQVQLVLATDATAGLGMASRRGAGKVRHLHTPSLWLQRAVAERRLTLRKEPGDRNPADVGTKHLDRKRLDMLIALMGGDYRMGSSSLALKADLGTKMSDLSGYGSSPMAAATMG